MRLTLFTDYGIRVLLVLTARRDVLVRISDIASSFEISDAHLKKVANALAQTGWVETVRGRNGGMRLATDPAKLTLRQIVEALEPDFALVECFSDSNHCALSSGCGVERALSGALRAFSTELERHTLADLALRSPTLRKLSR